MGLAAHLFLLGCTLRFSFPSPTWAQPIRTLHIASVTLKITAKPNFAKRKPFLVSLRTKMVDESLRIRCFDKIPSPEEFASQIEPKNVPAVFIGCVTNWKASSKWNPSNGGLDYLQERVGSSMVEAMLSRSAPVFYGDIRSHERVPLPFSTFIGYCNDLLRSNDGSQDLSQPKKDCQAESDAEQSNLVLEEAPQLIYLAQVPILNMENEEKVQLECLREDIQMPTFLETKNLASINLWMSSGQTRSSTHYDPHHNLLCIVAGCKQVVLWPPSSTPFLYPLPLYGEASNHSAVPIEKSDLSLYPRAERTYKYSQKLTLHPGDALFIPEGWFHQVDSGCLTIAVNFWWRSDMMSAMVDHMDAYYLRRILRRLTEKEMNRMLHHPSSTYLPGRAFQPSAIDERATDISGQSYNGNSDCDLQRTCLKGNKLKGGIAWHELEPLELQSLQELISLVHEHVDHIGPVSSTSTDNAVVGETDETKKVVKADLFNLEDDPIANVLWSFHALTLQRVLLALAQNFPRTLEALVLHSLSPAAAEVLTQKLEEMDQLITEEDRNQFYQIFYGVFDDQFAVMDALLNGKESFARQAYMNVLDQYLGLDCDGPKSLVR